MINNMKTIKLFILLLSLVAGMTYLTSCGDDEPEPMPVAKAPVFVMNENFIITATCPNDYKTFINGVEKTLPYTVTQTYEQQTIVVKGYGYGDGMQNSETVEQTFTVPAMEMPKAEAPVFAMNDRFEITATCANTYKAYVNGIETNLPYTVTQTYLEQTIVVTGYGYGINLQNSDTVEQAFVVPALPDNHEYVDLGLPSGTLWATMNVGANSPEEYGNYFAWGETAPKQVLYNWETYKWCRGSEFTLTKYVTRSSFGTVDNKSELEQMDDAATVNWGLSWCMPTEAQILELKNKCHTQWTTINGVKGNLLTGPNGNKIFLPASGGYYGASGLINTGLMGYYWSRTIPSEYDYMYNSEACILYAGAGWSNEGSLSTGKNLRCSGLSVRAVRVSQN